MEKHDEQHVFLSLGSNMGNRGANLQMALVDLERWEVRILRSSSIYVTDPVLLKPQKPGEKSQEDFYNMVLQVKTDRSPEDLLTVLLAIERSLGRERKEKWGPRTIDIDILFYGDLAMKESELEIPHPHLADRKFVLIPLCEIAPNFVHPVLKKTSEQLLKLCKDEGKVTVLS